ncbi:hypothetical protein VMF7928_02512 [Vibrio marisflavi CECT 7928]|uniref:tRNA-uridine aminocarboxypropyltransferase n=1 Tax=Vibrio marisflavi CECT 7928 TaxID=634439 RepID=A0ABN8E5C9_9VIBR|nr:hypothetical protein VMF7928_02512 [Vibrio marisflavi CECT 7928]
MERCQHCQIAKKFCICEYQPKPSEKVSALILVNVNELLKPSNTGRLIADVIDDCHVYQWSRTEPDTQLLKILQDDSYQPIVVFPEEYVENRERLLDSSRLITFADKKPLLIFLDGSWREARRMFRKSPYLNTFPVLSIKPEALSQYLMRKTDNDNHLATGEVASLVLEQLGYSKEANTLKVWFEVFRESYMLTKTRIKPDVTRPHLKKFIERKQR